jgi:transposase
VCHGVTLCVMEATSTYWKPPFYLLEDDIECWVVNARDVKNVPGRPKTDPAGWTGCGCASWPNGGCSGRRSRRRRGSGSCGTCAGTGAPWPRSGPGRSSARRSCWRTQIKLSSVISDIFGVSGRAMLEALIAGQHNPRILAELAQGQPPHAPHLTRNSGSLRGKIPTREGLPTPCSPPTAQPFL